MDGWDENEEFVCVWSILYIGRGVVCFLKTRINSSGSIEIEKYDKWDILNYFLLELLKNLITRYYPIYTS